MNISSVLVVAKIGFAKQISALINEIENCSVELLEDEKIVVVIEADDLDSELAAYKKLEKLPNIVSVNMVFSYQNLDEDIQNVGQQSTIDKINAKEDAKNINYAGDLKNRI